jgi:hypothetical protein
MGCDGGMGVGEPECGVEVVAVKQQDVAGLLVHRISVLGFA